MATAPVSRTQPIRQTSSLTLLKGLRAAILALDALLLVLVVLGTQAHRAAMRTVGRETAPTIMAAQRIKTSLADMDADAANELLAPPNSAPPSAGAYDQRRVGASEALLEAAQHTRYELKDNTAEIPIDTLQVVTGTYERLVQQALDFNDAGQADLAARYYRHAGLMMDEALLPAADQLDQVNDAILERSYREESLISLGWRTGLVLAGLLLLSILVLAQVFISRRMHRTLNPALLGATVVALWISASAFASMGGEERQLKIAKEDAFTSIRALSRARAAAFSANGEESRYLLDPTHAADYQAAFFERSRLLLNLAPSTSVEAAVASAERGDSPLNFTGYLADELNNITFPGEREAAVETLKHYLRYAAIDTEIRRLENARRHTDAIALCIGTSTGESAWAFHQFDQALLQTLDINRVAFDQAVQEGLAAVGNLELKACVAALIIAVLSVLGLAGRIREYQ